MIRRYAVILYPEEPRVFHVRRWCYQEAYTELDAIFGEHNYSGPPYNTFPDLCPWGPVVCHRPPPDAERNYAAETLFTYLGFRGMLRVVRGPFVLLSSCVDRRGLSEAQLEHIRALLVAAGKTERHDHVKCQ